MSQLENLLGNPRFMLGMGLLSAGMDGNVNPAQAGLQGLSQAHQIRLLAEKRKKEQAMDEMRKKLMEAQAGYYGYRAQGGAQGEIGNVTPSNYTPASLAQYAQSGNYNDLKRYEPQKTVEIGGVPHAFDPVSRAWYPAQVGDRTVTATDVGTAEGTAAATAADIEDAADKTRTLGSDTYADSLDKLQYELDWVKKNPGQFKSIFGSVQGRTPDLSQRALDAEGHRARIANLLTLASRGQLKGQGPVSDFESKMLADAATMLNNRLISDQEAFAEVSRIQSYVNVQRERIPEGKRRPAPDAPKPVKTFNPETGKLE